MYILDLSMTLTYMWVAGGNFSEFYSVFTLFTSLIKHNVHNSDLEMMSEVADRWWGVLEEDGC